MDPDSSDEMVDHLVDFFDRIAPVYDGWAGGQHARVASRLVDLAAPQRGEHALDVGTGTGLVAHLALELDYPGIFAIQKEAAAVYPELIGMTGEMAAGDDTAPPVLLGAARP